MWHPAPFQSPGIGCCFFPRDENIVSNETGSFVHIRTAISIHDILVQPLVLVLDTSKKSQRSTTSRWSSRGPMPDV